ncbi:hypothetical protein M0802_016385, partial [Mischocyttarus mexicanus]
MGVGI